MKLDIPGLSVIAIQIVKSYLTFDPIVDFNEWSELDRIWFADVLNVAHKHGKNRLDM